MKLSTLRRRLEMFRQKLAEHNSVQRYLARKLLPYTQMAGFSLLGDHFYEPAPNLRLIREKYSDQPRRLPGFLLSPVLAEKAEEVVRPYIAEYIASPAYQTYGRKNWFYTGWDAAYYYCLIRWRKPHTITEVGRGMSTQIACVALERNAAEGSPGTIVSIDPYDRECQTSKTMRLVTTELQLISSAERAELVKADILFVDSSHVVKWGSDVLELFQSWIPDVAPNTLVHIHDIFSPFDYPESWLVEQKRFWNEQYLFEAFIAFNRQFQIECPVHLLARTGAFDQIADRNHVPELSGATGAAMWLKKIK
jgi:hypothetical protein